MSPLRCAVLILALIAACAGASKAKGVTKATVYYDSTKDVYSLKEGVLDHSGAAYGVYLEEVNLDGWGKLNVTTNDSYPNHVQAIAAGYLEGAITQLRIWQNYVNQQYSWPPEVVAALIANYDWMTAMAHDLGDSDYWRHVDYMMRQLYGLSLGYASVAPASQNLTLLDLLIMNADGDMGDVQTALAVQNNASWVRDRSSAVDRALQDGCSGLVRWTSEDLFVSQTTWTEYNDALRILKSYHLHFKGAHTAAHSIVFSSYPGRLWSSDDFYVMSSGLAVIETTSSVFNNDLWNFYTNQSVYTWINTMVTNRLAVNAFNWTNIFALYSSGTYTNQWLIVDYNKYKAGARTLQQETLMLMEAIPGYTMSLDATGLLAQHGYVGSYNTWYIDFIYNATGYPQMAAQYGNWFTYNKTPRALIFARNATQVASLKHMHHLMTYNNFEHDPLSGGYAENAIAARSDLMPNVSVPFSALGTRCHGAIDSKVTSAAFVPLLQITAYGAPTHHQQPVFAWANATICNALNVSHIGMPESYPFDWITFSPAYFNPYV